MAMLEMNAITPLLRAETLCALFFPPVEKRLSLPPRLTPLSTNNFVRCTLQNRIIKSLFSKIRRKNKNKKKKHIVQASYEKQQQIFPCNNNKTKQCLCTTFSLSHYFSLIQKWERENVVHKHCFVLLLLQGK